MPSLPDTAVIIFLGLLLFGPKGLAQIARQLGKLMGEFRRASNEFRMQMEEELRISEQAERQKEIAAIEAAAPVAPALTSTPVSGPADTSEVASAVDHQHVAPGETLSTAEPASVPLPIASSGELSIMPPSTGLPAPRTSSLSTLIDSVPKMEPPTEPWPAATAEANGSHETPHLDANAAAEDQRPMRYTTREAANGTAHPVAAEETLHG